MRPRAWHALLLGVVLTQTSCPGLDGGYSDLNDAVLEITPEGQGENTLSHVPGLSEVRVTPPVDGRFTATFSYIDPHAEVSIEILDSAIAEQSDLAFPLDAEIAGLAVEYEDASFAAEPGEAQGYLTVERLNVDEDSVDFRGSFQGTVISPAGDKAAVSGYIDALYDPLGE